MKQKNSRIKENINQFSELLRLILPQNKPELFILLGFIIFYFSYSLTIALNTSVIDYQLYKYDVYFSFDNPIIYNQGYVYLEGHPLMRWMLYPFILLGNALGILLGYKAKTVFLTLICCTFVSLSVIYVRRYLKEILGLNGIVLSLLVLMYGFFSTNLILCFTIESFTLTIFLLSFTIYYYSRCMQQSKGVTLLSNSFLAIGLGGITLTNFAKGIIPMLFANESKKTILRKIIIVGLLFGLCIFIALLAEYSFDFIGQVKYRLTQNISLPAKGLYYEKIIDMLFTSPMFFSNIMLDSIYNDFGSKMAVINMDYFRHWWQYAFAGAMFILLAYSVIKNYKNKYVQLLLLMLAIDIIIHALIRYGLRDAQIYGGHWVFMVPFLLGWLYKSIDSKKLKQGFTVVISILFISILINNIYQLTQFIELAIEHFPPHRDIDLKLFF